MLARGTDKAETIRKEHTVPTEYFSAVFDGAKLPTTAAATAIDSTIPSVFTGSFSLPFAISIMQVIIFLGEALISES